MQLDTSAITKENYTMSVFPHLEIAGIWMKGFQGRIAFHAAPRMLTANEIVSNFVYHFLTNQLGIVAFAMWKMIVLEANM